MKLKSITDVDVVGKRVLLRTSFNVPIAQSGVVGDDFRLRQSLKTIEYLASRGAQTLILAHLGRSGESLRPVIEVLARMTHVSIRFDGTDVATAAAHPPTLVNGECVVFENVRRDAGEETNDPTFSKTLASLGELFVNDAFADALRSHASIVGVADLLPSYAGIVMQEEVRRLSQALMPPSPSLAIMGGAKFETKQPLIEKLLPIYAEVCIGGALANDFLKARGLSVGKSLVSEAPLPHDLLHNPRVTVEEDCIVEANGERRTVSMQDIGPADSVVDAGPKTITLWGEKIRHAAFVLWNGPVGLYEQGFVHGTRAIAENIIASNARAVIGGGDTLAVLEQFHFDDERVFRSTGGGAMLEFLAEGTLPGLVPLMQETLPA